MATVRALTGKQKHDILKSLSAIKNQIEELENTVMLADSQLLYFYEELENKANFARNFIKCAIMYKEFEDTKGEARFEK